MPEKYTFEKERNEEGEKILEIKADLIRSLNAIRQADLFENDFLDNLTLVVVGNKKMHKFENNEIVETNSEEFNKDDFMRGRRVDFVVVNPKEEIKAHLERALRDKKILEAIFFNDILTYDEFVVHEIAHNIFDRQYIQKFGKYRENKKITDVSDDYREKIRAYIIPLLKKYYPNIDAKKFHFKRQQIAEIFAFLYEREYCQRTNTNMEIHNGVAEKVAEIGKNPERAIEDFNKENLKEFSIEDFYEENHILSIMIAPILEKEYPNWDDRKNIFWK